MKPNSSSSLRLKLIDQTYEQMKLALEIKLRSLGYNIIDEKYNREAFGSRFVIWFNTATAIRLLWDGKDQWFYLQSLDARPTDWRDDWKDLIYIPYDPRKHGLNYVKEIQAKIIGSLS